jgi:ligand-binding sensor domain-containing protein
MKTPTNRIWCWCRLFWLGASAVLFAQPNDIRFDHITVEQGLSNFSINDIVQDRQGFLWFATEDGLNKYDGYEFKVYKFDAADTNSLPASYINRLYLDRAGKLWVTAGGRLCQYDPNTDQFVHFERLSRHGKNLAGKTVNRVLEDTEGALWIGTSAGAYRYDQRQDALVHYRHNPKDSASISGDNATVFCKDRAGALWIGTFDGGLNRYDRGKNAFVRYRRETNNSSGLSSNNIICLQEDPASRDIIWIGTNKGLCRYDRQTDQVVPWRSASGSALDLEKDLIFAIAEDSHGTLWVGTFHLGLWRYEPETDRFISYRHDPADPYSLLDNRVQAIYEDRSGVMWLGHYRSGLSRYVRRQDQFSRLKIADGVYAICQDRHGQLWIGADNTGLRQYDRDGKLVAHYRHDPRNPASLSNNQVMAIHEDRLGRLWIGTANGLNLFDANRRRFVRYLHVPTHPVIAEQYQVKSIYEDAEGEMWFGTKGSGLLRWDQEQQAFTYYRNLSSVWTITTDANRELWIGGDSLHRFDRKTQTFTTCPRDQKTRQRLIGFVYSVYADSQGYVWMGTFGGGLYRYDPRMDELIAFTDREGLPNNFVKGILPDAHGHLWLSTDKGLSRFDPRTKAFKNFTVKEGLVSNVLLSGAYYKNEDGRMFFGGEGGVVAFHPDSIRGNPRIPPVVITQFKVFDKPFPRNVLQQSHLHADAPPAFIRLSYRHNFFSFEFVALDYTAPEQNQYAYKLEGVDPDWVQAGTRRYANYTNVAPGEYVFRVKGSNSDGVWNEAGASVNIIITPPFWQTWWFRLLALAAISGLAWAGYRYRVNQLLQMERLRTRISADLHDEIAGNLSSIAMFGKIVQDEAIAAGEENVARSEMLQRIMALSQESVIAIREIIWAIDPKPETIHDLLVRLRDFAVNACRSQNMILKYEVLPQAQLPQKNLTPEQRKHLWLLLKEAINNAVKHSGGTVLELRALYESGNLMVSVIDNGAGVSEMSTTSRFSGKGLGTMKSRAEQLHGSLLILPNPEGGTIVTLMAKM